MQANLRQRGYVAPAGEPSLAELMADPIVHLMMRSDGVTAQDVFALFAHARGVGQTTQPIEMR